MAVLPLIALRVGATRGRRALPFLCRVAVVLSLIVAWAPRAGARAEVEVSYTREQTFSAALRYLRVDLAYDVTEKDPDAAYLLFSFAAPELDGKSAHGSIEIVQRESSVRVFVNLPQLPSYHEEVLKRGLLDKLRSEYGEPPAAAERPKPKPDKREPDKAKPGKPAPDAKDPPSEAPDAP
jgi:hypothetical protein